MTHRTSVLKYLVAVSLGAFSACQQPSPPPPGASQVLIQFLQSSHDRRTAQDLVLRPDGTITAFPSLRCAVMEQLRETDPAKAKEYASQLISRADVPSPFELAFAVKALSYQTGDPGSDPLLRKAAIILCNQKEWLQQPTRATLECFDLFVFGFSPEAISRLEEISLSEYPESVLHACEVAVHRMALLAGHPARRALNDDPKLWSKRPVWRGKLFAHSNIQNQEDALQLTRFLNWTGKSQREKDIFKSSFPAAVFSGTSGLISKGLMPSPKDVARQDAVSLAWIESFDASRNTGVAVELLAETGTRLKRDVAHAEKSGLLP